MRQKAPDNRAAPLCDPHHDELGGPGGRRAFESKYNIHLLAIADRIALKPFIYIESGNWVGRVEGEEYVLCAVGYGVQTAVARMVRLRRERLQEAS